MEPAVIVPIVIVAIVALVAIFAMIKKAPLVAVWKSKTSEFSIHVGAVSDKDK